MLLDAIVFSKSFHQSRELRKLVQAVWLKLDHQIDVGSDTSIANHRL